jgi:hypothetical protein
MGNLLSDSLPTKRFYHDKLYKPAQDGVGSIGADQPEHTPKAKAQSIFKHLGGNKESAFSPLRVS